MPTVQNLKKKLKGIRSTQKLTKAMKTASTVKYSRLNAVYSNYVRYELTVADIEEIIKPIGTFKKKSKFIKDIATPEERQTGLNNMIKLALDSSLKI